MNTMIRLLTITALLLLLPGMLLAQGDTTNLPVPPTVYMYLSLIHI